MDCIGLCRHSFGAAKKEIRRAVVSSLSHSLLYRQKFHRNLSRRRRTRLYFWRGFQLAIYLGSCGCRVRLFLHKTWKKRFYRERNKLAALNSADAAAQTI